MERRMFKKIKSFFFKKKNAKNSIDELDILKPENNSYIIRYRMIKYYRGFID